MKVTINREGCISCGLCAETCPEVFRIVEDGLAEVHHSPSADTEEHTREAADNCPVQVIKTEE